MEIQHRGATGETFAAVAAAVACSTKSIQRHFVGTGGLAPGVQGRSQQQIAHRLRLDHPAEPEMRVSHETIYRSLFVRAS